VALCNAASIAGLMLTTAAMIGQHVAGVRSFAEGNGTDR
jgi:hypothetical protein